MLAAKAPSRRPDNLERLGRSRSDDWNQRLANDFVNALWTSENNNDRDAKFNAAVAALVEVGPKADLEGMPVAQLLATYYAAMECFRRAMLPNRSLDGRSGTLKPGREVSRTHTALLEVLNRYRGKGQQKVTVGHAYVRTSGVNLQGQVLARRQTPGAEEF